MSIKAIFRKVKKTFSIFRRALLFQDKLENSNPLRGMKVVSGEVDEIGPCIAPHEMHENPSDKVVEQLETLHLTK